MTALALLAACEPDAKIPDKAKIVAAENHARARAEAEGSIPCALDGAAAFERACTVDRTQTQDGLFLTVRHPNGEFHRLLVVSDGRGVIAADGAEQAEVKVLDQGRIEVAIANARYRLPATVRP